MLAACGFVGLGFVSWNSDDLWFLVLDDFVGFGIFGFWVLMICGGLPDFGVYGLFLSLVRYGISANLVFRAYFPCSGRIFGVLVW